MRKIDATTLRPGARLPMGLYTRQGIKLLSTGTILTEEMCRMIAHSKWADLFLATSAADMHEAAMLKLIDPVTEGSIADADVVTAGGTPLVEAGQPVERHHADAYELGAFLSPDEKEDLRLRASRMKIADQYVADLDETWKRIPRRISPSPTPAWAAPSAAFGSARADWPDEARLADFRAARVGRFRRIFARVLAGLPVTVGEVLVIVSELVHLQRANTERFAQLALLDPRDDDYLPEHAYAVACLSVAIAARLGWSDENIRLAGMAGLLADAGMALIPAHLRASTRPLNEFEINRVRRHPTFSVVLLDAVEGLPEVVRLAAYQHHERENGSGYPRGLRSLAITDLARVISVADAFAAAAVRRMYRAPRLPYDALEEVIMQASNGRFHRPAVRALVESTGLFPIGSHVLLSNDRPAMVVGAKPDAIDRPIIRMIRPAPTGASLGLTVHLTDFARNELWIRQPIEAPSS